MQDQNDVLTTDLTPGLEPLLQDIARPLVITPASDVPGDASTTVSIQIGDSVEEALSPAGDQDWYRLTLAADEEVSISIEPRTGNLPEGIVEIAALNGTVLETRIIGASNPLLFSQASAGEVFVRVISTGATSGEYLLVADAALPNPHQDPNAPLLTGIDTGLSITGNDSDLAGRRIDFSFAETGDVFDNRFTVPDAADLDWTDYEKDQLRAALQTFADVLDVTFNEVTDAAQAELTFFAAEINGANSNNTFSSAGFLGFAFLPLGGSLAGNIIFNVDGFGWDRLDTPSSTFDGGLEQFGLGFQTILHEVGHAFGLDHPFEADSRSTMFPGIVDANGDGFTDNPFDDAGDFGLNQTVYSVMSDVTGWTEHPDGTARVINFSTGPETRPEVGGYSGGLMALDIAAMQGTYGANESFAAGDDTYTLPDSQTQNTGYTAIWDTGGTDEITYTGQRDAVIDLRQATLQVEDGGGGFMSFVDGGNGNNPAIGGFTIAAQVEIENASSDQGDDVLRGNDLANTLSAGAGNDTVDGGGGDNSLDGGAGVDIVSYGSLQEASLVVGTAEFGAFVDLSAQGSAQDTGAGSETLNGFEGVEGSVFADLLTGDGGDNTLLGADGSDLLNGGGGADRLEGGDGFDVLNGGAGADELFGGAGFGDVAGYFDADGPLVFEFGADFSEIGAGSSAAVAEDTIDADIEGIIGASGFSNTFDASGIAGLTFLLGGSEADTFEGGSGVDQLLGLDGDDVIRGNGGGDALIGGLGDDDLFGGGGGDVFFFTGVDGDDVLHDFETGSDAVFFTGILLSGIGDLTITTVDADGDQSVDDGLVSYSALGVDSTLTFLNVDGTTLETTAGLFLF